MIDEGVHPNSQPAEPSDEDLIARIHSATSSEDKRAAWEPLLLRYQPLVHSVCRQMMGRAGPVDDAAHDALVKIMRGLHTFDGSSKLSTWIYRVTMNSCLTRLRGDSRRLARVVSGNTPVSGARGGDQRQKTTIQDLLPQTREPGAASGVEQGDQRALVMEALNRLDPDLRSVLLLRDGQGLQYTQIADLMEVRVGTIKSRIFRARLALRQMVEHVRAERQGPSRALNENEDDGAPSAPREKDD